MQEYHLAKRKKIWYGSHQTDPCYIEKLASSFAGEGAERLMAWKKPRYPDAFGGFHNALFQFGDMECADQRDKIYALLSLLEPDERQQLGIFPDYSKTATDLFLGIMSTLLRDERVESKSLEAFYRDLVRVLTPSPDLYKREVQCLILDLAASGIQISYPVFKDVHHQCGSESDSLPVIGPTGCSRCHLRPFVRFNRDGISELNIKESSFSRADWQRYAWGLLTNEQELDKEYGAKLLKDTKLRLDMTDKEFDSCNDPYKEKRPDTPVLVTLWNNRKTLDRRELTGLELH